MKKIFFLWFILVAPANSQGKELYYDDSKRGITEQFLHQDGGLIYNYRRGKQAFEVMMNTNKNNYTIAFTNITEKRTNFFSLSEGNLLSTNFKKQKIIDLQGLDLIIFPEIQLRDFVTNTNKTIMSYVTIKLDDCQHFTAIAKKHPQFTTTLNGIKHSIVEVYFANISPEIIRYIYYFDPQGIATKKEVYFLRPQKPYIDLEKDL